MTSFKFYVFKNNNCFLLTCFLGYIQQFSANSNTSYNTYIDYDTDNTDIAYRCASAIQLQWILNNTQVNH